MVHGGGHHRSGGGGGGGGGRHSGSSDWGNSWSRNSHQNHHGGGWFGGGRSYQDNVVFVNNHRAIHNSYQDMNFQRELRDMERERKCEDCCRQCCISSCLALGCVVAASEIQREAQSTRTTNRQRGQPSCGRMLICPWSFFSVMVLVILLAVSGLDETWTFNPGETRRVVEGTWLMRRMHFASQVTNSINIYAINGHCPPLTGPLVTLSDTIPIKLAPDDYQFDYFFLNEGSAIDLVVTQDSGASNVMVLRGTDSLERMDDDEGDDYDSFSKQALLKRFAGAGQQVHVQYTVSYSDVYVLLYDNASSGKGKATVEYNINATTYNLSGAKPKSCLPLTCTLLLEEDQCILVQAIQTDSNSKDPISVRLSPDRRWGLISILAVLPIFVGLICWRETSQYKSDVNAPPATAPHRSMDGSTPTAPLASTAPMEAVDYESIPIVSGENVVPVAVPVIK